MLSNLILIELLLAIEENLLIVNFVVVHILNIIIELILSDLLIVSPLPGFILLVHHSSLPLYLLQLYFQPMDLILVLPNLLFVSLNLSASSINCTLNTSSSHSETIS